MRLSEFARAEVEPGYYYELARGVVEVTKIPSYWHNLIVDRIHAMLHLYQAAHPDRIHFVAGSFGSKIEMWGSESERHPDLSVYLSGPPEAREQPWDRWVPDIVVEVVSPSSAQRDYQVKPKDYLMAGVREYWIIDPPKRAGLFLARRADTWLEKRLGSRGRWRSTLLPGLTIELSKVLAGVPGRT